MRPSSLQVSIIYFGHAPRDCCSTARNHFNITHLVTVSRQKAQEFLSVLLLLLIVDCLLNGGHLQRQGAGGPTRMSAQFEAAQQAFDADRHFQRAIQNACRLLCLRETHVQA